MRFPTAPALSPLSAMPSLAAADLAASRREAAALALYIHWPFCQSKCPYCDFNSHARRALSEEQYVQAALAELDHYAAYAAARPISSVFFGGGTPSLMAPQSVAALLDRIAARWPVEDDCEITLEANPTSAEAAKFQGYRRAGVNRISLGVQALSDAELRFLGRRHSAAEARHAVALADRTFARTSFDLIYARPGQSEAAWREELREALGMARGHLSLYQLTIEPGTAFFDLDRRGGLAMPGQDLAAGLYAVTQEMCEMAGLPAYEISNHAAPGEESRHNLTYWRYGDYLGIGPGAHGRLTVGGKIYATAAVRAPEAWYAAVCKQGSGCEERSELAPGEQAEEALLMGLRLSEGLNLDALSLRTGFSLAEQAIAPLQADGLLFRQGNRLGATPRGRLVLNALIAALVAGLEPDPIRLIQPDR